MWGMGSAWSLTLTLCMIVIAGLAMSILCAQDELARATNMHRVVRASFSQGSLQIHCTRTPACRVHCVNYLTASKARGCRNS